MIYDCFTFFNEFDVLDIRLAELADTVDCFVIAEATTDFVGNPKPLHFLENAARYAAFAGKIRHIVVDDMPADTDSPWTREFHQRNALARGVADATAEDWIILSDVDEIPRREAVRGLNQCRYAMVGFRMSLSYFRVNFVATGVESQSVWSIAYRGGETIQPQDVRDLRAHFRDGVIQRQNPGRVADIPHGGWHLSYMGDEAALFEKVRSFSHQEVNDGRLLSGLSVSALLESGGDVYRRPGYTWQVTPLTGYFPRPVVEAVDRYSHLIAPWG